METAQADRRRSCTARFRCRRGSSATRCLRSPHIDRKSREQFEIRTHKRLIDILQPTGKTIEALNKGLSLPPGVDIKIRVLAGRADRYGTLSVAFRRQTAPQGRTTGSALSDFLRVA